MRLIHTADWQIGKVFRFVDRGTMGVLQEARLEAISAIGRLATEHGAPIVLVAGDIYDIATAESRTLAQPLARMHAFAGVEWHLIPGNHDPHQPGGPWERLLQRGLPANVRVHLEATPVALAEGAALLPAPLARRRALADPTAWMDQAATPEGTIRIGLAHGSISAFGSDADTQPNLIDPGRPEQAGLAYLALGDWHGTKRIGPRCWYAGTPEIDDFEVDGGGHALLVDLAAPGAPPDGAPAGDRPLRMAPRDRADPRRRRGRRRDGAPARPAPGSGLSAHGSAPGGHPVAVRARASGARPR